MLIVYIVKKVKAIGFRINLQDALWDIWVILLNRGIMAIDAR